MELGKLLWWKARPEPDTGKNGARSIEKIVSLSRELLSDGGGIAAGRVAADILRIYKSLSQADRLAFFDLLVRDFSPNPEVVGRAADAYRLDPSPGNLRQLQMVVEPPRQELFRRLNSAPDGTRELIEIRRQVLNEMEAWPQLEPIAGDLGHLMASWFNSGFLTLERIDWHSSAVVLEKLIAYEAVHQIQGWNDLRRRLEADRRCYAFFHSALPGEPLIFIEVALTRGMSDRIQPLIEPEAPVGDPEAADHAIFYSITNCQQGLRGVPFGSSLIKQVVEDLKKSLPRIKTYATLSPIPGFRKWLDQQQNHTELQALLNQPEAANNEKWPDDLRQRLLSVCASYLLNAKRNHEPLDSVARFHLKNGARLERINWMGDSSGRGIKQSFGLMANYVYELENLQRNHEAYTRSGEISSSRRVERLARQAVKGHADSEARKV
ncbi:MAG TPA: malonyl-CoA decarboxylase [Bryobacteraceae bacterium]|nr:malonyl-CoA decarboxylase [Bryobacteraceae bacterium]